MEDIKKVILDFAEASKKTKFYFNDITKAVHKVLPDKKARE
ncbi:MAG: sulfite reductase, partial [Deltaproteobacteria bacterium]|nr:sulfite reductase [Deltaproteobacteria bacterium]